MSEVLAKYSFLPWVRQGLGNNIIEQDTLGNAPANPALDRPEVVVSAKVKAEKEGASSETEVSKIVKIQGPGDVLGINHSTIIRVHPKRGVTNYETNNLCYVEFYEEDLPWRFSPASPNGNKLRPWLALIVLRKDEFTRSGNGATPTPFISINQDALPNAFGDEADIYALAHVHVLEDLGSNPANAAADLQDKLEENPDIALSRVISARKLEYHEDDNEYHAFLVPAFETGRLAGMGMDTSETPAQQPSWTRQAIQANTNPTSYPFYYSWSFKVDQGGDFETLVEKLTARELPENIGKREIDLKNMGFGIEPEGDNALGYVEGAMRHPDYATQPWPMTGTELKEQLRKVLNLSSDLQDEFPIFDGNPWFYDVPLESDPIITPPTYGKWHRAIHRLQSNGTDWVHDINLHPSHRAAAGLGTRVVQQHQEEFMEMAWEQIGEINEANQKIIENELAKRIAASQLKKKIKKLDNIELMATVGNAFSVLKTADITFKNKLKNSVVPTAMKGGALTKVANNFTKPKVVGQTLEGGPSAILNDDFIQKVDDKNISAAPSLSTFSSIALAPQTMLQAINFVVENPKKSFMQELSIAIKAVGVNFQTGDVLDELPNDFTTEQIERATDILNAVTSATAVNDEEAEMELIVQKEPFEDRIGNNFDEAIYENVRFKKSANILEPILFNYASVIEEREFFQGTFNYLFVNKENPKKLSVFKRTEKLAFEVDNLKIDVLQKFDPILNFSRKLGAFLAADYANKSKPIMAYPRFPFPVYDYLKEISPDYIIPNISEIEPDTITLMEPNKKFIEAFMAGMNHEFSRELLWREFPTDMRGSYFRHFWEYIIHKEIEQEQGESIEDYMQRVLTYENNKADIEELHKWKNKSLGENHLGGPSLVLLIKGDLFKKYPNTLVYAQKADWNPEGKMEPRVLTDYQEAPVNVDENNPVESNVRWPILKGSIEPDVHFFGFDLTEEEAEGNRTDNPGWFFVLRERPGEINFGLDDLGDEPFSPAPENWNHVTWEHVSNDPNQQPPYLKITEASIPLSDQGSGPRAAVWGRTSSDMAYILFQSPILFARHASTMLKD